jgi:hypothetical protein
MNKTIKSPGGITVRMLEALNGFKRKHGYWPSTLTAGSALISFIATTSLTPLGFFLLQSKVELVEGPEDELIASGREGDSFNYGEEGWQDFPVPKGGAVADARAWLGLVDDDREDDVKE